jgi:STE24 endopeptidase
MDPGLIRVLFLSAIACGFVLESGLDLLNRREILRHPRLPERFTRPPFAGRFTPEGYARSRAYALERLAFGGLARLWSAILGLGLLFSGCLPAFDHALALAFGDGLSRGVLFLAAATAVPALLNLPFAAWSTFRIEGKYGFNTMTWGLFWRDSARELALSAALGLPLLYALMAFFRFAGARWWLWAFAFALAYQVFLLFLYPGFIAPLFNRFTPLAENDLRRAILSLAERMRFPSAGIFVMDGSRRSLHSNAYFTGFGRFRRIVLFDTLIRRMEQNELVAVLAHEIGHYRLKHVRTMFLTQALLLGALLFVASLALRFPPLYQAFGFHTHDLAAAALAARPLAAAFAGPPAPGLYLFIAVFSALGPLFAPLRNLLSRRHEYQADAFAVETTRDPDAMRSALIKLSEQNLSNLTPHPWYSAFHFSHPTLIERVLSIERAAASSS